MVIGALIVHIFARTSLAVPVAAVVAVLHRLAYNFGAGPDDNEHKKFPMGKEQIMIKEQKVACITGTNPKKVLKHAELVAAIANNTTKPAIQQYPTHTHLGKDVSPASGPIVLDARLTDDDVIALPQTAYPEMKLEEIQETVGPEPRTLACLEVFVFIPPRLQPFRTQTAARRVDSVNVPVQIIPQGLDPDRVPRSLSILLRQSASAVAQRKYREACRT